MLYSNSHTLCHSIDVKIWKLFYKWIVIIQTQNASWVSDQLAPNKREGKKSDLIVMCI